MPDELDLHPGTRIAFARTRMNETDVARAIAAGELTSPQQFANSWYFDLRLTGTGAAFRQGLNEYVWRDPSIYLNQDFLDRCNGLPVIIEHPPGEALDSVEYLKRNIGSIVLPYIRGDEVWGVARILDQRGARYLREHRTSTSPGVVFSNPASENETIEAKDGKHLLIEGDPNLLDHVAICEEGVWDKGGPPTGVDSTEAPTKEGQMAEEKTKTEKEELEELRADKARRDAEHEEMREKLEAAERERDDARKDSAKKDEHLDKLLKDVKVLNDRMDSMDAHRDDRSRDDKKDASAEEEAEHAEQAATLAAEEAEEAQEAAGSREDRGRRDRRDAHRDDRARDDRQSKKFDAKKRDDDEDDGKMPWAECDRKDEEEDEEFSERMDAVAAKCDAQSFRKRDDESMAAHCDRVARGARRDRARRADRQRMDAVDPLSRSLQTLEARVDRLSQLSASRDPEDENAFAEVWARADSVFQANGEKTPRPGPGQTLMGYRIGLLRKLQKYSDAFKNSDIAAIARADADGFGSIEGLIYADAQRAADAPVGGGSPTKLIPIKRTLESGHTETRFKGNSALPWMSTFMAQGRTTRRLGLVNQQT